jgi:D-3-phosphoglycerate dehydrogenase
VFTAVAGGLAQSVTVDVRGKLAEFDTSVLSLAVLRGIFADVVEEQVTYVNAPLFAEQRGLEITLTNEPDSPTYRNHVTVRGAMADGRQVTVSGTLYGKRQTPRLTEVADFEVDLEASGYLLFFTYTDRPGVVGTVGAALGEASVNIAGAQVSRTTKGGEALMAVTVDNPVSPELLADIAGRIGAREARAADLNPF